MTITLDLRPEIESGLLAQATAKLTVYAHLRNLSAQPVSGTLEGTISRQGKPTIHFAQAISELSAGQEPEVVFTPDKFFEIAQQFYGKRFTNAVRADYRALCVALARAM